MNDIIITIDIGGTNTKIGIVSNGTIVGDVVSIPSDGEQGVEIYAKKLLETIKAFLENHKDLSISGLGIAVAGFVDDDFSMMVFNPNLPWLENFPLGDFFSKELGLPVFVEVDSNAAALAEAKFGSGKESSRLLVLAIGTGLGGGMVVDGKVLRITNQCLGDVGHVIVEPGGDQCESGCRGCAEAYVTGPALEKWAENFARKNPMSMLGLILKEKQKISGKEIIKLAKDNDQPALDGLRRLSKYLGIALASMAPIFLPDSICIAGGISEAGEILINETNIEFNKIVGTDYGKEVKLKKAHFGWQAGLIGAAAAFENSNENN
jgi:glucokinase